MPDDTPALELFCPRCKILIQARVAATLKGQVPDAVVHEAIDPDDALYSIAEFLVAFCGRCHGPFLIERTFYEIPGDFSKMTNERVLYPEGKATDTRGLPASVRKPYESAVASFERGLPEPCLIMCRKCLEAVCREFKVTKGDLKTRLDALRTSGNIDDRLAEWAHELRLLGNDAAHDLDIVVQREDARDALDFTEAILVYCFSLRSRFEAFKTRRQKKPKAD